MTSLYSPITLPGGMTIPNRIAKAAMEENMADYGQVPSQDLIHLYRVWAEGGAGLILTGNVMVDPNALTGPGGIVLQKGTLDDPEVRTLFEDWAKAGKSGPGTFWMQISHPGRQVYASQGTEAVSASATTVEIQGAKNMFACARALTSDEIQAQITRFADTAHAAHLAGFDGVQVHAAHGYLVAQFLSPLTNLRDDEWGGSLENRARFLLDIVRAIRARVPDSFGVAVKLNSADFQRGGFDIGDARQVVEWLNAEQIDFVELSGGSYESAAMMGLPADERFDADSSTAKREMYFVDFAQDIAAVAEMPLMVTGGVTQKATAENALATGKISVIGIARAHAFVPNLTNEWQADQHTKIVIGGGRFKNPMLSTATTMAVTKANLRRIGAGKAPKANMRPILSLIKDQMRLKRLTKRYQSWLQARG